MAEEDWSIYSGNAARDELVQDAMNQIGPGKPVVIINLLRFREVSVNHIEIRLYACCRYMPDVLIPG